MLLVDAFFRKLWVGTDIENRAIDVEWSVGFEKRNDELLNR